MGYINIGTDRKLTHRGFRTCIFKALNKYRDKLREDKIDNLIKTRNFLPYLHTEVLQIARAKLEDENYNVSQSYVRLIIDGKRKTPTRIIENAIWEVLFYRQGLEKVCRLQRFLGFFDRLKQK